MTVTIAGVTFDRVRYDAEADVLYLPEQRVRARDLAAHADGESAGDLERFPPW